MSDTGKTPEQLERELEAQRSKIENRIGEIRERLSPGQLVDEVLSYGKDGGQQFAANFGATITNNPLPAALLGVSLLWLMSGQGPKLSAQHDDAPRSHPAEPEYPYGVVGGSSLRRVSHAADESGRWTSEFQDTGGRRYKAESNEHGHRIGAFIDDSGRKLSGFISETGHRIRDFEDEAGNRFEDATGWASHRLHDLKHGIGDAMSNVAGGARHMGQSSQHQLDKANRAIVEGYTAQPLIGGALAFAVGAALGATLPHTDQEDKLFGKASDKARREAGEMASELYDAGKEKAGELYEQGKDGAKEVYESARTDRPTGVH